MTSLTHVYYNEKSAVFIRFWRRIIVKKTGRFPKKITSVILALLIAVSAVITASVTAQANEIMNGTCGTDAVWRLYSDNALVISGTGAITDYTLSNGETSAPWKAFYPYTQAKFMQKVIIAGGITHIGSYAFYMRSNNNYNVNLINLADTVETIGDHAFCNEGIITNITIPQKVTSIGVHCFDGCTALKTVNCYVSDPAKLTWDISQSGLESDCKIHVLKNSLSAYQSKFSAYSSRFVGDLTEPTNVIPNGKNIFVSYDDPSPSIFGGALPYSVKYIGKNNVIFPITYGARGFVTCIKANDTIYALTGNNSNGTLSKINIDTGNERAGDMSSEVYTDASLKISHEYIGANSVKIIYTVKNNTASEIQFKLGSSGDIKIGSDDYAAITDLSNTTGSLGITMTSSQNGDKVDDKSPTLGFAGKQVGGSAGDANFFYGVVGASKGATATGVKADICIPERIFEMNDAEGDYKSKTSGGLTGKDSGLSFHWDVTLEANKEKQYAVIFSVPNTTAGNEGSTVINEVESNIGTNHTGTYTTSDGKTIFFANDVVPSSNDAFAKNTHLTSFSNFLLLGAQKKTEIKGRNCVRFISVINTDILKDADEYGYIIAKSNLETATVQEKIGQVQYDSKNIYKKNIKETSNKVSGDYGLYDTQTPYKYVTLGINDVPNDIVFAVRFYVKKGDTVSYADYYNQSKERCDGLAVKFDN